jgi:hypothetical protein
MLNFQAKLTRQILAKITGKLCNREEYVIAAAIDPIVRVL